MFKVAKGFRFQHNSKVAKALNLSRTFVSLVIHGKAKSQRVANYLYENFNIILNGYKYDNEGNENEKASQKEV